MVDTIWVLGQAGRAVTTLLTEILKRAELSEKITVLDYSKTCTEIRTDLCVFSTGLQTLPKINCKTLLLPGNQQLAEGIKTDCAVSYGLSSKDTLTLSSIGESAYVAALQREIETLSGSVLECQEIPLYDMGKHTAEQILAAVGAALIVGVPPEKLE